MKSEVKAMVTALKTERDRLDVAIQALTALAAAPEPVTPKRTRRTRQRGLAILPEAKTAIVSEMRAAGFGNYGETAKRLGVQYGLNPTTIQTSWQKWAKANGSAASVQ
jgi:hypothetical protein